MARQATLNTDESNPLNGMIKGVGDLGGNVVNLAALQAKLALEDFRESSAQAQPALIALSLFVPIGIASVTIGLFGLAYLMASEWNISLGRSMLMVSAGGLLLTAVSLFLVVQRLFNCFASFRRSREELERNIAWLRTVLIYSGR